MNTVAVPGSAVPVTLKDVVDRLTANPDLSDTRKRDLRSAVVIYGKLKGEPLSAIPLDLAAIRRTLEGIVPAQAKVSRKRWANLRSDLVAALDASGLQPMLKTADVELDCTWAALLRAVKDKAVMYGLSRLARWATARQISPAEVDDDVLERFFSELEATSLVCNLRGQRRTSPSPGTGSRHCQLSRPLAASRSPATDQPPRACHGMSFLHPSVMRSKNTWSGAACRTRWMTRHVRAHLRR